MNRSLTLASLLLGCVASLAAADEQGTSGEAPVSKATNLQVLARDFAPVKLGRLMKRYERDLGVKCSYCHVENRDTGKLDYASDENPKKHIARVMMAMVDDINERHLEQLGTDRRYAAAVTCGSCHQGRANPQPFEGERR